MKVDMNGIIYSLTYALDCIEAELVGVSENHAKWVAYLSVLMGKARGYSFTELSDLAACAALHDNALTQYLDEERSGKEAGFLGAHCVLGEKNVKQFPFYGDTNGFILYHHENIDGSGPLKKTIQEIPIQAHIIHLADMVDVACDVHQISKVNYQRIKAYLEQQRNVMFQSELVDQLLQVLTEEKYLALLGREIDDILREELPHDLVEYPFEQVREVMEVFGRIVDYKSPFTHNHSDQIAHKIYRMAEYYGYSTETNQRLYIAGALHDIGKMAIKNDILEKPDKLDHLEFARMQNHAWYTYMILNQIKGFEDITEWASLHHEKLNGSGYPFGKTAEQLTKEDRLMACIDIYQALSEDRPYKKGMPHEKCIAIMRDMVDKGLIDKTITEDINHVFG